jgi:hypothetical protein
MNGGDFVDRLSAEAELIRFVKNLATTIDGRKPVMPRQGLAARS